MDKLLRMKPKEYKNVSQKEKDEIKTEYEFARVRKEIYEENIKKIEKMVPLEYLSVLNSETKEKLIGLCLDKKLMGNSKEDEETMYEEEGTGEQKRRRL